jgi:hypothetical protein
VSAAPSEAERVAGDRVELLRRLGATDATLPELLRYSENPYRELPGAALPLADEPQLPAWRDYATEATREGVLPVLARRFVQLRLPVAAGLGSHPEYRAAIRRGVDLGPELTALAAATPLALVDPAGVVLEIASTVAGAVPIVVARERADFVTLVRALAGRNEPIDVPDAMGACLVKGLVNWDRVRRHRARWALGVGRDDEASWQAELARLTGQKDLYQDRLLLLSSGPYSAVDAGLAGRPTADWRAESVVIRRDHEAFHYLTLRLFGLIRSNLLDELLADLAGLLAAYGRYDRALALQFLGLTEPPPDRATPQMREGGRLAGYRGDPPLSDAAYAVLLRLALAASRGLAGQVELATADAADPARRPALLLRLAALGLHGLASLAP